MGGLSFGRVCMDGARCFRSIILHQTLVYDNEMNDITMN